MATGVFSFARSLVFSLVVSFAGAGASSRRREPEVQVAYRGFEVGDAFVVGYGLDHAERWRNLPFVGVLDSGSFP